MEHNVEITLPFSMYRTKSHWFWLHPNNLETAVILQTSIRAFEMIALKTTWVGLPVAVRNLYLTDVPRQVWASQLLSDCVK